MRVIKANWDIFKAKFSENPQENFEWFCYLLFSKEYNQTYGIHRYKNQSGIETDPIEINDEVIGWQSKFYEDKLSSHEKDLIKTLEKTKRDYQDITKIIFYTNVEWTKNYKDKNTQAERTQVEIRVEEKAKELKIKLVWRAKSYFESSFVCQEQRDISRYFFELDIKWELTSLGFKDKIIKKYQTNFKTITLLLNDEKPIDDIFINLAIIKEETEKDKKEKEKEKTYKREAILNSYEEIHKPKEPIKIEELLNISNKSLIYGKAGVGKTTLCKYIAYKWSKNELYEAFDYVVYIALREWKRDGLKGAILDNYYSSDIKNLYFDIEENSSKTLFLFDGYDELDADKKATLQKEINIYNLQNYIITTRPYGYQKSDFNVDESFETIGFTDENVEEYIENFFDESQKEKSLKEFLQNNINIKHIAYIPLMLEMICSLWEDEEFQESVTMTELYGQVVENILSEHSKDKRVFEWENREEIKELLGKIAFNGLTKQSILFNGKFIKNAIDTKNLNFFKESIINSGFLKSDRKDKSVLGNNFEFLHLTFQEYFSALYVSKLSKKKQKKIIKKWKFYPHMQVFFAFLGGLIKNKEFLLSEIESDETVQLTLYKFMLILTCLQNIKKEELKDKRKNNILDSIYRIMKNQDFYEYPYIYENITSIHHLIEIDENKFSNQKEFNKEHRLKNILFLFSIGKYDDDKIEEFKEIINSLDTENMSDWFLKRRSFENLINNGKYDKKVIDIFFDMKRYRQPVFGDKTRELFFKKYIDDYKEIIFKNIKEESFDYFIQDNVIFNLFKYKDYIDFLDEKEIERNSEFTKRLFRKLDNKSKESTKKKEQIKNNTTYKAKKEKNINEEETFSIRELGVLHSLLKNSNETASHELKDYLNKYNYKLKNLSSDILLDMVDILFKKENLNHDGYIQQAISSLLTPIKEADKYDILLKFLSMKELESDDYELYPKTMKILKKSMSLEEFMKKNILDENKIKFLNEFSVKELFENYKTDYDHYYFEIIYYKIIRNGLPLYLKENRWHTIVDGEEIKTQEKLNEEDIKRYGKEPSNKKKKLKKEKSLSMSEGKKANTNDEELNKLIEEAKNRFISNDKQVAIEKLWDAFERLKTYFDNMNKKQSANKVLEIISKDIDKDPFEDEFKKLTTIGNDYRIRHHETNKKELTDENREYFFKRMFSLIDLCVTHLNEEENVVK